MKIRWSKVAPQVALMPAVAVTLTTFVGAVIWTIYVSFANTKRFPDYSIAGKFDLVTGRSQLKQVNWH